MAKTFLQICSTKQTLSLFKSPLSGYWQIKEKEKYPTDGLQQGVLEKCNIQNFSKKALIAFAYCQEKPIHNNNTFIQVSKLLAPI